MKKGVRTDAGADAGAIAGTFAGGDAGMSTDAGAGVRTDAGADAGAGAGMGPGCGIIVGSGGDLRGEASIMELEAGVLGNFPGCVLREVGVGGVHGAGGGAWLGPGPRTGWR